MKTPTNLCVIIYDLADVLLSLSAAHSALKGVIPFPHDAISMASQLNRTLAFRSPSLFLASDNVSVILSEQDTLTSTIRSLKSYTLRLP